MEQRKLSTKFGGIDVGKRWLDGAVHGLEDTIRVRNDAEGVGELIEWMKARGVVRVGLEASGAYERLGRRQFEAAGFEVVLHQALEVKLFARLKRLRAKNDRLDAALIAAATAQVDQVKAASDQRLQELADRLTAYEHVTDQLAELRCFMEHERPADVMADLRELGQRLARLKQKLARRVLAGIRAHADLAARLRLLRSLPGVGVIVGCSLVVRMPELGAMSRGQAAALLGVAPYDRDSGQFKGHRFIGGGRSRPRRHMYLAAMGAKRSDPTFRNLADRLLAKGKPKKVAIVAVMRKLIEAANLVLARQTPWLRSPA
jgi:transposase